MDKNQSKRESLQTTCSLSYKKLVGMIPLVIDFLDLNCEEIIASGVLDDSLVDNVVLATILHHLKTKQSLNNASSCHKDVENVGSSPSQHQSFYQTNTHESSPNVDSSLGKRNVNSIDSMVQSPSISKKAMESDKSADNRENELLLESKEKFGQLLLNDMPTKFQTPSESPSKENTNISPNEKCQSYTSNPMYKNISDRDLLKRNIQEINHTFKLLPEGEFRATLRMTPPMFEELHKQILSFLNNEVQTMTEENDFDNIRFMLILTLRYLGSQDTIPELAEHANVTEHYYNSVILKTLQYISGMIPLFISWPTESQAQEIKDNFRTISNLTNVMGSLQAMYINVSIPDEQRELYENEYGNTSVYLQTVRDDNLKFVDCNAGWPGSVHKQSISTDFNIPPYTVLVGDSDYGDNDWLVTPCTDDCLNFQQHNLNSACQAIIERHYLAHKILLSRFPRLLFVDREDIKETVQIILTCCALHNFCIDQNNRVLFSDSDCACSMPTKANKQLEWQ